MNDLDHIFHAYPDLRLQEVDDTRRLVGAFPVRLPTGEEIDRYILQIELPYDLKTGVPIVFEMGGRIPRKRERHCLEPGNLCVFLREERYLYYPVGSDLLSFLNGPLNSYLFGQLYFDEFKVWPANFREWNHGILGRRDFYREFLNLPEASYALIQKIVDEVRMSTYRRHKPCPCESGKKTKNCHWLTLFDLERKVENYALENASTEFEKFKEKEPQQGFVPGLTRSANATDTQENRSLEVNSSN